MEVQWNEYEHNKPENDGFYLVSVKIAFIIKHGLQHGPNIIIAKYTVHNDKWLPIFGNASHAIGNIKDDVVSWCILPTP